MDLAGYPREDAECVIALLEGLALTDDIYHESERLVISELAKDSSLLSWTGRAGGGRTEAQLAKCMTLPKELRDWVITALHAVAWADLRLDEAEGAFLDQACEALGVSDEQRGALSLAAKICAHLRACSALDESDTIRLRGWLGGILVSTGLHESSAFGLGLLVEEDYGSIEEPEAATSSMIEKSVDLIARERAQRAALEKLRQMTSAGNEDASAAPVARIGARKPPEPARSQAERRKGPHPVRIKDLCLELFEARPGQSLHYREIARLVGKNAGSVSAILSTHIEFKSLGEGVWELDTDGNQKGAKPPRPVSHQYTKQKEISLSSGPRGVLLILVQQGSRSRERIHGGSLRSLVDAGLAKNERGVVKATQLGRQFIERAEHKQGRYRLQLETREAPAKSTKEPVPVPSDELLPVTPAEVPAL